MSVAITEVREEHIDGCHAALDVVARERKYLTFLEAPPIEASRAFIRGSIANRHPHFVALEGDRVVGWCDVTPRERPATRHGGVLGMGVLPEWRGRGLGQRLMERTLEAARALPLARVELAVRRTMRVPSRFIARPASRSKAKGGARCRLMAYTMTTSSWPCCSTWRARRQAARGERPRRGGEWLSAR
jgi:GNAT superfamily N-acetyltransferase